MSSVKKLFTASALLSGETILRKLVGLVSTLILARILVPEDFGIIAIALMVMGLFEAVKQFGGGMYLMRAKTINADMVNTAWTIGGIAAGIIATLFIIAIPFVVDYFDDDRLRTVLWVYASLFFVKSLGNPGTTLLRREQNYLPIVKMAICSKIISVVLAVTIALIYKNYWALIVGQYSMALTGSIGSYFIHPHRPRLCLSNFKDQWNFSGWWLLQSVLGYGKSQLDTFVVSSLFNKASLGSYHTVKYLSSFPLMYLIQPLTQPLLVQLSKIRDNKNYFTQQYVVSLIALLGLAVPICAFMMVNHLMVTEILLGANWTDYSELFAIFSITTVTAIFIDNANRVLIIDGRTKINFYGELICFSVVYGLLLSVDISSIKDFALLKVSLEAGYALIFFIIIVCYYVSYKACLSVFLGLTLIIIASTTALAAALLVPEGLPLLIYAVLTGLSFVAVYLIIMLGFIFTLSRVSSEWRYLENLIRRFLKVFKAKIRPITN